MNKNNLEILGLNEYATREQIEEAYRTLKEKYREERFLDGEAGNNAARMLTKIEVAYSELISELSEQKDGFAGGGEGFTAVEELIKQGKLDEAQRKLDAFNERSAQWHYLQSVVFFKKNWKNESKKQLEIAIMLDNENEKYKKAYKNVCDEINNNNTATGANSDSYNGGNRDSVYRGQNMDSYSDDQMGDSFCADCVRCCAINACINCLCNSCFHC